VKRRNYRVTIEIISKKIEVKNKMKKSQKDISLIRTIEKKEIDFIKINKLTMMKKI
jgi:hypothetical protein